MGRCHTTTQAGRRDCWLERDRNTTKNRETRWIQSLCFQPCCPPLLLLPFPADLHGVSRTHLRPRTFKISAVSSLFSRCNASSCSRLWASACDRSIDQSSERARERATMGLGGGATSVCCCGGNMLMFYFSSGRSLAYRSFPPSLLPSCAGSVKLGVLDEEGKKNETQKAKMILLRTNPQKKKKRDKAPEGGAGRRGNGQKRATAGDPRAFPSPRYCLLPSDGGGVDSTELLFTFFSCLLPRRHSRARRFNVTKKLFFR